ncbi:MAG: hypothetical protein Kow00105_05380 [Phycisphaeraceae bacterium]
MPKTDSHTIRRIKFGLNVSVAVLAALGLVVLLNWIAARQYVRADLTRGGSYSLSEQTQAVLDKLGEGYRIVTLIPDSADALDEDTAMVYRRVRDMADEYGRYTDHLKVEHLDPRSDISKAESLNQAIAETFKDELEPVREAIRLGQDALQQVLPINQQLVAVLTEGLNDDSSPAAGQVETLYQAAATSCSRFRQTAEQASRQAEELMNQVLVNYAGIKEQFEKTLTDYDAVLGVITQRANELVKSSEIDNADKERLLQAIDLCKQAQSILKAPMQKMAEAEDAPKYNQVFYGLSGGASVVLIGPGKVKVVPVSEMWRQDARNFEETGRVQPQYLIEEKLTGALLSMTLEQPPLVVFVLSDSGAALGPQGHYQNVARRLESADFDVTQWNPSGQVSAMGQPTPPMPRPEPEPGQKVVWVVLPTYGNPMGNPMMMGANARQQIADLLKERVEAGDAAMVMLAPDPSAPFGLPNPITEWLNDQWGITAQTDRIILQEVPQSNRRMRTVLQFLIDTWPTHLPITAALDGMQAAFQIACPLLLGEVEGVKHYPLIEIKGERLWAHTDLSSTQAVQNAKFDESTAAPQFTIAVASEKDNARLVTIAEQAWASDDITGLGLLGPGTAELTGAMLPGNSELFVNCVFWLAGLEDLIAASPRTQDVPRVNRMTPEALWWHQTILLAGLPASALVLGLGVWWVRRRA